MSRKTWTDEKLFFRLLNNKTDKGYYENRGELTSRGNKYIFEKSVLLTHSTVLKERVLGLQILAQLGWSSRPFLKQTLKLYFNLLKTDNDPEIVSTVLYGIGHNNQHLKEKEIVFLSSFLNSKHLEVRKGLTLALGGIDHRISINTLVKLSKDRNDWIRNWATFGIGSSIDTDTEQIRNALWKRINDKCVLAHEEGIFGLARRKDPGIKEILVAELEQINHHGSYILEAIEAFQDKDFIRLLKQKIKTNKRKNEINEEWLKNTLNKLTDSKDSM